MQTAVPTLATKVLFSTENINFDYRPRPSSSEVLNNDRDDSGHESLNSSSHVYQLRIVWVISFWKSSVDGNPKNSELFTR